MVTLKKKKLINTPCPCGSGLSLQKCCAPLLADHSLAKTPEELMRSRYVAYVLKDENHLLRSWHKTSRPGAVSFENSIRWLGLEIFQAPLPAKDTGRGIVTYKVSFIQDNFLIEMREKSFFIWENNLWFYLHGELSTSRRNLSLNATCPCGSGKKYKRCCRRI